MGLMGITAGKERYRGYAVHVERTSDKAQHWSFLSRAGIRNSLITTRPLRIREPGETISSSGSLTRLTDPLAGPRPGALGSRPRLSRTRAGTTWSHVPGISSRGLLLPTTTAGSKKKRRLWQILELCKVLEARGIRRTTKTISMTTKLGFLRDLIVQTEPESPDLEEGSSAGLVIDDPATSGNASKAALLDWRDPAPRGKTYSLLAARWMRPLLEAESSGASGTGER